MTNPKDTPAHGGGVEAGSPLTPEELQAVYAGPHYEAAISLIFGSQDGTTIGEIRDKLRAMLAASPAPDAKAGETERPTTSAGDQDG